MSKEYVLGITCAKWLAIELERLAEKVRKGVSQDEVNRFDLKHCFIEKVHDRDNAVGISIHVENLEEHDKTKARPEYCWVCSYCTDCGRIVYTSASEEYNADYRWTCSNDDCGHSKVSEHTADSDLPSWTAYLPEDIGNYVERQKRIEKGLLQRLYERDVNFRLEVDEENGVVHQRIMMMELLDRESHPVAHVFSDTVEEAERWLLNRVRECDPAAIESLEKEMREEEEYAK